MPFIQGVYCFWFVHFIFLSFFLSFEDYLLLRNPATTSTWRSPHGFRATGRKEIDAEDIPHYCGDRSLNVWSPSVVATGSHLPSSDWPENVHGLQVSRIVAHTWLLLALIPNDTVINGLIEPHKQVG